MKKTLVTFFIIVLTIPLLLLSARAAGETEELLDGLPDEAREQMKEADIEALLDTDGILKNIIAAVQDGAEEILHDSLKTAGVVLLAAILCALGESIYEKKPNGVDYIAIAGTAVIGAAALSGADSLVRAAAETVEELQVFSTVLLPTLTASSAAAGAASSAAVKYSAAMLFVGMAANIGNKVIVPLVYVYIALSAGAAAFKGMLGGASKLIKRGITACLSTLAIAFTLYITLTGTIASSADETAVKLTKVAVSGMLPVVGGIISDAADVVVSGAGILKNSISVFGMLAVCAICALPFFKLLVNVFVFKTAAMLSDAIAPPRISGFINSIGTALTMTLSLVGTLAVMLFISIVSFMKSVVI